MTDTYSKLMAAPTPKSPKKKTVENTKKTPVEPLDTKTPSNHGIVTPLNHDTTAIEYIRKAVKDFGKEAATHRFTLAEKQDLAELVYLFKKLEVRTSENEITRIAINWLIRNHQLNADQSVLHKALNALHK